MATKGVARAILPLMAFSISVALFCADVLKAQTLQCQLVVERDTLLLAEPIWVDVNLANTTMNRIESMCFTEFPMKGCFELTDEAGTKVPYSGLYVDVTGVRPVGSGKEWNMTYNLLDHFGQGFFDPPRHLPAGRYEVRFVCGGLCDAVLDTFVVLEPRGTDLEAYNLYARGKKLSVRKGRQDAAVEAYEAVLSEHSESRYAPSSLWSLISVLRVSGQRDQAVSQCHRFISIWPNSEHTRSLLTTILSHTESKQDGIDLLNSIIAEHPNTRVARFAGAKLRVIQSGKSRIWKHERGHGHDERWGEGE